MKYIMDKETKKAIEDLNKTIIETREASRSMIKSMIGASTSGIDLVNHMLEMKTKETEELETEELETEELESKKSDDIKKTRFQYINNHIVFPITEIIEETTILNSLLGLEEYNADNIQKKGEENTKLFIPLLDKYIPNWDSVYSVTSLNSDNHKFNCLYLPVKLERLQDKKQVYLEQKNYLLTVLMESQIMSPAKNLTKELCKTEYGEENGAINTKEDMMEIMLQLGIPSMVFARYCKI